ncbi:MAG TPA: exodeoxyribonuclease III [Firmicutes bacterium]|nr:exodeoxyribonuclease III [Bacillota bacterium]
MQFISWNVNGLRACVSKGFMDFFSEIDSDFFCLQEIRLQAGQIELELPGYHKYWNYAERKGYSGTAVFTKHEPLTVTRGLGKEEHDREGRLLTLEYESFYLVNVYTPNSQRGLGRLDYRLAWDDDFRAYLSGLSRKKEVIVCGDLNVAHQEIDLKNPQTNRKNAGFTDQERAKFTELLAAGFIDSFRHLYPEQKNAYTWWSYFANSRARNIGWRIDYFLISRGLREQLTEAEIYAHILGSDHCPVGLKIKPN